MGAVPESLAAAELFGARRGAFTGAEQTRKGYFEHAHTGTLFLDEIGETPLGEQALLLRALESGEIQPVGPRRSDVPGERRRVDVRVITATDADLEEAVAAGRFRAALLHRLEGFQVHLPPLRRRRDDIGRLLHHFLKREAAELGLDPFLPPAWLVERLALHPWPGNVRELQNVARRLVLAGGTAGDAEADLHRLLDELLGEEEGQPPMPERPASPPRRRFRKASEISGEELREALRRHRWRLGPTARALRVSRATLYRLLEAHPEFRKAGDLTDDQIEAALARHGGDVEAAAAELEVSPHGLKIRRRELHRRTV
jgi:two-component system nitrogen regulation response regulator GlnG